MDFQQLSKQVDAVPEDGSVYADILNHCKDYKDFLVRGSKTGSAHECSHGINAALRNANGAAGARINAFYVRQDRYIVLPEPACKKSDAIPYIPQSLRKGRFSLYVQGQTEWNSSPLYLCDEWNAYTNQAYAAIDLYQRGEKSQTDEVYGALEFVAYITGMLMAADKVGGLDPLKDFMAWHLNEAFAAYFAGRDYFIMQEEEAAILAVLQSGGEFSEQRQFLQERLGFTIPGGPTPPSPPTPPAPIDWGDV